MKQDRSAPAGDPLERFERALADWARRPPGTPAPVAARRLLSRLEGEERTGHRPWSGLAHSRLALGLATAAAVVVGSLLVRRVEVRSIPDRGATGLAAVAPPAAAGGGDLMVLWLDAETPLYLNLPPADKGATP